MKFFSLLICFLCLEAFSQAKIKNKDLRRGKKILSISHMNKMLIELKHESNGSYLLHKHSKDIKVESNLAKSLEEKFLDQFIELKYSKAEKENKKCKDWHYLYYRHDEFKICSSEKNELALFLNIFKKY